MHQISEDSVTIRKAMVQIKKADSSSQALNQAVRWINVKEDHASHIIDVVGTYLLCQRVKAGSFKNRQDYLESLAVHHSVMQSAMKCKQTVDETVVDTLDHDIGHLVQIYSQSPPTYQGPN